MNNLPKSLKSVSPFNSNKTYTAKCIGLNEFKITQLIGGVKHSETTADLYRTSEIVYLTQDELQPLIEGWKVKEAIRLIKQAEVRDQKINKMEKAHSSYVCVNSYTEVMELKDNVVERIELHTKAREVLLTAYESLKLTIEQIQQAAEVAGVWWECYYYDENGEWI